jgi:predicted DNA-binding protein (UPF0251 family)
LLIATWCSSSRYPVTRAACGNDSPHRWSTTGSSCCVRGFPAAQIFFHCAKRGIGGLDRNRVIPKDEAEELAIGTVGEAIEKFRDRVLIPGKWDHTKGATLKTYFIGQCVLRFPNVYRAWCHNTAPPPRINGQLVDGRPGIINVDALQRLQDLEEIDTVAQEIAAMAAGDYMGYTHEEIAERLGTTARSVESKLWRHRQKIAEAQVEARTSKR